MTRLPLHIALLLFTVACGASEAPERCQDLVEALCANTEETCMPPMAADDCLDTVEDDVFNCEDAAGVSKDYEACLEVVETSETCLLEEALPEVCERVILYLE